MLFVVEVLISQAELTKADVVIADDALPLEQPDVRLKKYIINNMIKID